MKVDLTKVFENREKALVLSRMLVVDGWNIYIKILEYMLDKARYDYENKPEINDTIYQRDWRYKIGYLQAIKDVLSIPEATVKLAKEQ